MDRIYQQQWIELPRDVREHLVKIFGIVKTGPAEIRDQVVISDGVTTENLHVITSEKMAEYTGGADSFSQLWIVTVSKAKSEVNSPMSLRSPDTQLQTEEQTNQMLDMKKLIEANKPVILPFCNDCDSKGVAHKKICPHYIPTRPEFVKAAYNNALNTNKESSQEK